MNKKNNQNVERDKIPTSVEETIPIQRIFEDGIFLVGRNLWAKTYRFTDINYEVASKADKEKMVLAYCEILNMFEPEATTKITINNSHIPHSEFEAKNMLPLMRDGLDSYRHEYNTILDKNLNLTSAVKQDKYITVTIQKPSVEEARSFFTRVGEAFKTAFAKLGSELIEITEEEKIRIFFDFFHKGDEDDFHYDRMLYKRRKHSFKLALAPQAMEFHSDYFKMDGRYGRVLYLKDYANFIKDSFISELTAIDRNLMLSIDADMIPKDKAVKQGQNRLMSVETNITNWQKKQNQNNNFSATVPYEMELQREESREFLDDLSRRDQRMMPTLITIVHTAESKKQLEADTKSIMQCARRHLCSLAILRWQQLEGLKTCLPYGGTWLNIRRTLTTESLAAMMPFRAQEISHDKGLYLGNNAITKKLIMVNRLELLNGNSFILGVSGSGKSILAKQEIVNIYLSDKDADIIIIDPEREYRKLTEALNGENIVVSATSENHINALDVNKEYADGANPAKMKSDFILSLCEEIMGGGLGAKEKSIIDRCCGIVYRDYVQGDYQGRVPTLKYFHKVLLKQPEAEALEIALAIELFVNGSLNTFAKPTNVNTESRLICYDIHELGRTLRPVGMLVILDNIFNRITANKEKGKKTYVFIDEIYLLFLHEYSAEFLFTLWKRVRKYGAFITGITQNVDDLLQSHTARTMLANSELVVMLNQATTDKVELAELFNMSEEQVKYITNTDAGSGLARIGGTLVPFKNKLPKETKLYKLMTTKFGE